MGRRLRQSSGRANAGVSASKGPHLALSSRTATDWEGPQGPGYDALAKASGNDRNCVRREKAALSSGCKSHPANAPAGSNRSSHGGNKMAEAFGVAGHV